MSSASPPPPINALLIDNYDSFTLNLSNLLSSVGFVVYIIRNDDYDSIQAALDAFPFITCVILSPGPGTPHKERDVGLCKSLLAMQRPDLPIFGVCLGMQAMAVSLGGTVQQAPTPKHGIISSVSRTTSSYSLLLRDNIPSTFDVVRYHSLCVTAIPSSLVVTSLTIEDDVIMSLEHSKLPWFGVQFHPESICAGTIGTLIARNFHHICQNFMKASTPSPPRTKAMRYYSAPPASTTTTRHIMVHVTSTTTASSSPQAAFQHLFSNCIESCVFLDSSSCTAAAAPPTRARFSYLCGASGPLGKRVKFVVHPPASRKFAATTCLIKQRNLTECHGILQVDHWRNGAWVQQHCANGNVFQYVRDDLKNTKMCFDDDHTAPEFDFQLGYVGYVGYGMRKCCVAEDNDDNGIQKSVPLAPSPPTSGDVVPDASFLFCDRIVVFDHQTGQISIVTGWTLGDEQARVVQNEWNSKTLAWLTSPVSSSNVVSSSSPPITIPVTPQTTKQQYIHQIQKCLSEIHAGESYEICLTTTFHAQIQTDPWQTYCALRMTNPAPFGAFFRAHYNVVVCSSSPERFLRLDRAGTVESRPIKGTRKRDLNDPIRDATYKKALGESIKDRAENLMIVDLVRNDLAKVCHNIQVPDLFVTETFATVHQLVSTVTGQLNDDACGVDVIRAAFPPGSMTGAPKLRTMQIIDELEGGDDGRGVYSGCLGYMSLNGTLDFSVVIRTLVFAGGDNNIWHCTVGAGGAIIALSDPEEEWQEVVLKLGSVRGGGVVVVDDDVL